MRAFRSFQARTRPFVLRQADGTTVTVDHPKAADVMRLGRGGVRCLVFQLPGGAVTFREHQRLGSDEQLRWIYEYLNAMGVKRCET